MAQLVLCSTDTIFTFVDSSLRDVPYRINKKSDCSYIVEFKPTLVGDYLIHISMNQTPIYGSPFKCSSFDINQVLVYQPREGISIYQEIQYESK